MPQDGVRRNELIRAREVRVIGADGEQLGILQRNEAIALAKEGGMDLVEVASTSEPPVCRIMDYGKFRFEQQKKEKEARKNQRIVDIKEIRLSLNIDTNDFNTKVNHAKRFLNEGDKVKASIRFRGREMAHTNLGYEVMKRFAQVMSEFATIEKQPKLEGRSMQMYLAPLPKEKVQNKEEK